MSIVGKHFYIAHIDEIERVVVVAEGDGGHNLKRRLRDPVVVYATRGLPSDEFVIERAKLYENPLAASIRSAELAQLEQEIFGDAFPRGVN